MSIQLQLSCAYYRTNTLIVSEPEETNEEESDSSDSKDEKEQELFKVDVDIGLTAFANARKYYEQKKSTAAKHEKTIAASSKVICQCLLSEGVKER